MAPTGDDTAARSGKAGAPLAVPPLTGSQKVLAAVGGVFFAGLAGLGGYGSFSSVRQVAQPWFGSQAWIVPAGVDLGILALVSVALLLEWLAMPMPTLRWMAMVFTGATVWLNVAAAHGDPTGIVMHAAMPVLFVTFVEAVRHAIRRRAGIAAGTVREGIPAARWILAPASTFRLWRRMVLWQITSYPKALQAEQRRRNALALLGARYGRAWKTKAPADVVWMLTDGVMLEQALARVVELTTATSTDPTSDTEATPARHAALMSRDIPRDIPRDINSEATRHQGEPTRHQGDIASMSGRHVAGDVGRVSRDMSPEGDADTEARALVILASEPDITGADLGRRLDLSARQGQRLLSRLATRPDAPAVRRSSVAS